MPDVILGLDDIKAHLALTPDQTEDDWLLQGKLDAATSQIERMLASAFWSASRPLKRCRRSARGDPATGVLVV